MMDKGSFLMRRRHKYSGLELAPVMDLATQRLQILVADRSDFDEALGLFKVLWRFQTNKVGRPSYPIRDDTPICESWDIMRSFLKRPFLWVWKGVEKVHRRNEDNEVCVVERR